MSGKKRHVQWQKTKDVKASDPEDGYWRHYHSREEEGEDPQANPDVLETNASNLPWPSRYTEVEQEVLDELKQVDFSKLLSPKEAKIITLIVVENKNIGEIQDATGLSKRHIYRLVKSAGAKIKRYLNMEE